MKNTEKTEKEDGHERFKRVASKRTKVILDKLRVLGHCANRSTYKYTDQDVKKVFHAIEDQLKIVRTKFKSPRRDFKL